MSDIRLKTITVDNSPLIIKKFNIHIQDTSPSNSILTGSLIINGGIGINTTYDSVSSTSGGALSIGGGLGVKKQTFLGDNLIMDNINSSFSVNGLVNKRLFLDNVTNKYFYISSDGMNKEFELYPSNISINISTPSVNSSSGSLIVNGGLSINTSIEAISYTNGGSLTVNGGMSIKGKSFLGSSLNIGKNMIIDYNIIDPQIALKDTSGLLSTITMVNNNLQIVNKTDILFNTTNGNFIFKNESSGNTLLNVNSNFTTFLKYIHITDTVDSINHSTGSLIVNGGVSISSTKDTISYTSGGALTIAGGVGIYKKTITNDSVGIELVNGSKSNKLILYQTTGNIVESSVFTGLGIESNGSLRFNIPSNLKDFVFYNNTSEVFRIKGTNELQIIGNTQKYSIIGGGNIDSELSLQSQTSNTPMSLNLYSYDGDNTDDVSLKIFGTGVPNTISNDYLKIGWNCATSNYTINSYLQEINIQTDTNNNQILLNTSGNVFMSSTMTSINSSSGGLVLSGGLSINNTQNSVSLTNGGALTINGGVSIKKSMYVGESIYIFNSSTSLTTESVTNGNLLFKTPESQYIFGGNNTTLSYNSSMSLYVLGNNTEGNYDRLNISNNGGLYNINSNANNYLKPILVNTGTIPQLYLDTQGNVGINTTSTSFKLDINGTLQANNYNFMNQLTVYNTSNASSVNSSGSLTVLGGTSISKNLLVGGLVSFTNTSNASMTSASVLLSGGLSVQSGQASNYGFGALTVVGGAYIGGELYVQQNINLMGTLNVLGSGAPNSFSYISITATDEAINLSTGSLITYGGITIQSYANSESVTNGGSLLTPGGASIGQDLYIGGNVLHYGINKFYSATNNQLEFYNSSNLLAFSINRNTSTNNLSISRYNTLGQYLEKSIDISSDNGITTFTNSTSSVNQSSGAIVLTGGLTINCSTNSSNINNGGSITSYGGATIRKDVYIGGQSFFLNTTNSTSVSNGSVIINGGVGIGGNLNILGNTVLNGNLTVVGTTVSVESINTTINDNIILLNSGPSGTKDSGILNQRYQSDNNAGSGDVVNDNPYISDVLPDQTGIISSQVKFSIALSNVDNYYTGWWIKITSGYTFNQIRKITNYVGSTRIATISSTWDTQNPSAIDTISLYNKPFVGMIFNEINDRFEFGSTIQDPGQSNVIFTDHLPLYFSSATMVATQPSSNSTTGSLRVIGGISVSNTSNASSVTSGGALTINGGASIMKNLYIGGNTYINDINVTPSINDRPSTVIFNGGNNVTQANLISFSNTTWGFDMYISVQLIATTNLYSNYHLRGINKDTTWDIIQTYVGDQILSFNINNSGQLLYTSLNYPGFVSLTLKYKTITN